MEKTERRFSHFQAYRSKKRRIEVLFAWGLILPSLAILVLVIFYPLVQSLLLSFSNANMLNIEGALFVGLDNFKKIIQDNAFWVALKNTIIFVGCSVAGGLIIGMALALILNENIPFRNFFRGIALIPWVVPGVVVALLVLYMFNSQAGIVNWVLVQLGFADQFIDWFGSTGYALWAEIVANIWNQTPFYMLMILAGLQTVPQHQHEAAMIDGASTMFRVFL